MDVPNPELDAQDGREGLQSLSPARAALEVLIRNVLPQQELPLLGRDCIPPSQAGQQQPSLAAPGHKELADAVFYQLLWKPAAILIISSSSIGQVLLLSAQPCWPQSTGWTTSSTWQGHVEMECRLSSGSGSGC